MPHLHVVGLRKEFGSTVVLDGVSFTVQQGECVALLGPSGCGKTTTLRCIGGLESPTGGEILLTGIPLNGPGVWVPPQERNIGMVFQSFSVWPHLTVFENVAFGLKLKRMKQADIKTRVAQILEMMMLGHLAQRRSAQLSGGQLQRVALARTLVVEPKLVLFDEPLSNLDAKLRVHMRIEIRSLLKRLGMSAVYVTHDQEDANIVADRTAVMNGGRIEQIGTWKDLYFAPESSFVAGFMSTENTMDGEVVEDDGDRTVVQLAGLTTVSITAQRPARPLTRGDTVKLYIPREAVTLCSTSEGSCCGRIEAVSPSPGFSELTINLGLDRRLMTVVPSTGRSLAPGEECGVDFAARYIRILPHSESA